MKRYLLFVAAAVLLFIISILWVRYGRDRLSADLAMESDAMSIVNYYYPKRIQLASAPLESGLTLPDDLSPRATFGALKIGNGADSLITVVLDESPNDKAGRIYIDKNNNQDLSDDGEPVWDDEERDYWRKEVLLDVYYREHPDVPVPYPVNLYRYKDRLQDSIIAFRNGFRKGRIALRDSVYLLALFDDDVDGIFNERTYGALVLDLNRDGVLDGNVDSPEYFLLSDFFSVDGATYRVADISPSGDRITFAVGDTLIFPKTTLEIGEEAPHFSLADIEGNPVDLTALHGNVVLLDFWATWCQPWEENLSALKRSYARFESRDFEIIGLSLDTDIDLLQVYVEHHGMPWPQICQGNGWDMSLLGLYGVDAIPQNFLLDKDGVIRYKNVYGRNLNTRIYELLNE